MNKYIFKGTLGGDAEVKTLDSGSKAISFSVAITEKWNDKSGEKKEKTTWVKCTKWVSANGGTKISEYLKKGTHVLIEGTPSASAFKNKEGDAKASLDCNVRELELLGGKKSDSNNDNQEESTLSESSYQQSPNDASDDLPF